ncbi:hypothetical protein EDB85DRAFT_1900657 [Lactarius pseudohatsudake]|nr:hypothetical protein EDB85DRAFT_1900657 [Lactarius pseudohatsudake]
MTTHVLRCVLIDLQRQILLNSFQLRVPSHESYRTIFSYAKIVIPSLKRSTLSLYQPLIAIPSGRMTRLTESQVDLETPVPEWRTVNELKQAQPDDNIQSLITINLRLHEDIRRVSADTYAPNHISELGAPDFVNDFNEMLNSPRPPLLGVSLAMTPDYPRFVKDFFGDVEYGRAYRSYKERHVYSLLRRLTLNEEGGDAMAFNKPWPFPLVVKYDDDTLYQYTPRSDFLRIAQDESRMLLQGACIVRLGNALLNDPSNKFIVKAIYIDEQYDVNEYTLFQGVPVDRPTTEALKFVLWLYNLLDWSRDRPQDFFIKRSPQVISFVGTYAKLFRTFPQKTRTSGSKPRTTQTTQVQAPIESHAMALVQKEGYNIVHILRRLQEFNSVENHAIELLDDIHSDGMSILVMPWKLLLDPFLRGFPNLVESMWSQFLDGVRFLHEHRIAHLNLKPENTLARGEETLIEGYRGTIPWSAPEVGQGR